MADIEDDQKKSASLELVLAHVIWHKYFSKKLDTEDKDLIAAAWKEARPEAVKSARKTIRELDRRGIKISSS